jgi:pSer/pThr/pTyr-binding forkhead associated (FHA) protein
MQFRVMIMSGSRAGQELVLPGPMLRFGRDPSCEVAFDPHIDTDVSTNHAQLLLTDQGQLLLTDLGSSNGTFVNGQKVERPTPVVSGSMILFGGEKGVQVAISLVNPNDPNAHKATVLAGTPTLAEQPKKSRGKLLGMLGCLALLVIGGIVSLVLYLTGDDGAEGETAAKTEIAKTESAKTESAKTEVAAKTESAKTEEPEGEEKIENPWKDFGVGSRFVFKLKSKGTGYETESTMTYTLLELNDEKAVVEMKTEMKAMPKPTINKLDFPFKGKEGEEKKPLEEKDETLEVPAGKYDCTYRKFENEAAGQKSTTESWTSDDLPLVIAVKSVTTSKAAVTTMTLMEVEKK